MRGQGKLPDPVLSLRNVMNDRLYIQYEDGLLFLRTCPVCGRFVKADETVHVNGFGELAKEPNATCSKDGRVEMPFQGYY